MRNVGTVLVLLAAVLAAGWLEAAPAADTSGDLPATLERVTGARVGAYIFFAVMAFLVVLLIYRGVRAR